MRESDIFTFYKRLENEWGTSVQVIGIKDQEILNYMTAQKQITNPNFTIEDWEEQRDQICSYYERRIERRKELEAEKAAKEAEMAKNNVFPLRKDAV